MEARPITAEELKWVGVDFDNTLATNSGIPNYLPGDPIPGAKEFMDELTSRGFKPVIYTARNWADYTTIENWLKEHNISFRRIICGKPLFYKMIDDKAVAFKGDWDEVLKQL